MARKPIFTLCAVVLFGWCLPGCDSSPPALSIAVNSRSSSPNLLFCTWNVENFFDDVNDNRTGPGDKEYDGWFAQNPTILQEKLRKMGDALLSFNDGRGPDIIGLVEVESRRAAELLQKSLNSRLDPTLHYNFMQMKELTAGRHIAPAIISRVPIVGDRTRLLGKHQRILQTTLTLNNKELVVIMAHWTSRLKDTNVGQRAKYGDQIYGSCKGMYLSNRDVDILVAGDFNDTPQDDSVFKHLKAVPDAALLAGAGDFLFLNLMGTKDARSFGTHYYSSHWNIFDQVVVSPGMLDQKGWTCDPSSIRTVNSLTKPGDRTGKPWRFGGDKEHGERGFSDHFPVTVRLRCQPG